jgi:hypothetical protein
MHPKAKNYLLIFLALTSVSTGYLAWQQTQRLNALMDGLIKTASTDASAKKRLATTETATPSLKPTEKAAEKGDEKVADQKDKEAKPKKGPNDGRPDFATLMANPEFAKAVTLQQRAGLDERYANLFKMLKLSPAELETFKNLLVERQAARMDVMTSARDQGVNLKTSREDLQKLTRDAQAEVDASIKAAIGEADFNQYRNYDKTLPQRDQVSQLDQRLSYSGAPLTSAQTEFLVAALTPPVSAPPAPADDFNHWDGNRNGPSITDAVIQQAQSVLTAEQLTALKQIQAEQQARQKIRDMMRPPANDPKAKK